VEYKRPRTKECLDRHVTENVGSINRMSCASVSTDGASCIECQATFSVGISNEEFVRCRVIIKKVTQEKMTANDDFSHHYGVKE
jgi:hypothetical protein